MTTTSDLARERIGFFVREGLIPHAPTPAQLEEAEQLSGTAVGPLQRIKYYLKHPLDMLPTAKKKAMIQRTDVLSDGGAMSGDPSRHFRPPDEDSMDVADRGLRWLFRISPVRFGVQLCFNPYYVVPGSALGVPAKWIIEHILHSPHLTALWDVQLLLPIPDALDELAAGAKKCRERKGLKSRVYRALVQRDSYYDYLLDLIERVRIMDFPAPPPNYTLHFENLVEYLKFASELNVDDGEVEDEQVSTPQED